MREDALKLHRDNRGKLAVSSKVPPARCPGFEPGLFPRSGGTVSGNT